MSERQTRPYGDIARKWHALAERRRPDVVELRDSGRWRHYYTWDELLDALREAVDTRDMWARLAGLAEDETSGPAGAAVVSDAREDWLDAKLLRGAGYFPASAATRQTVLPTSSAIKSAPVESTATPTGRL